MIDLIESDSDRPPASNDAWRWAEQINAQWRQSYASVIEAGRILLEAKACLPHGSFEAMVQRQLEFSPSTAQRLMIIARDHRLTNPAHVQLLPRSYGTLYELSKLTDEQFKQGVERGIINPDMERKDVELIRPTPSRQSIPESADGVDPDRNAAGGVLIPSMVEERSGEQEAEQPTTVSAGAPPVAALPAPADPAAVEGANEDAHSHAPPAVLPGGGLAIAHPRVEPADSDDFFPTPPWATRALVERVLRHLERDRQCKFQNVWEPACGEGHMLEVLGEYFRGTFGSDKIDYGRDYAVVDFLDPDAHPTAAIDWIITNPPFNTSTDFVLKALDLAGTGVAMFVRAAWLEGVDRYERIFSKKPPTLIAYFTERVPLHKGRWEPDGATFTAYVWLVWLKGAEPRAPFWIPPGCRKELAKPEDVERFAQRLIAKQQNGEAA